MFKAVSREYIPDGANWTEQMVDDVSFLLGYVSHLVADLADVTAGGCDGVDQAGRRARGCCQGCVFPVVGRRRVDHREDHWRRRGCVEIVGALWFR